MSHPIGLRRRSVVALGLLLIVTISAPAKARAAVLRGGSAEAKPMGVASVNLWHKDRPHELQIMADHLRSDLPQVPDFILCQEVVFGREGAEENTAAVLARHLGYHSRGTKRTSDSEGVAIISRYPFAFYGERHLKSQTARLLLGFRRVSVMGEFMVPQIGRVRVVNVHLTNWGFEGHVRRKQLQETLQWIAERQKQAPAAITFLGGDFNAKRHWDEMKQLDQQSQRDGVRFMDFNSDEPSMGSPGSPNKRIDYIFVSAPERSIELLQESLLWKDGLPNGSSRFYLSDHLCLFHLYSFAPRS